MSDAENKNRQQEQFMREAIQMADRNVASGKGGPFAALVVKDGKIIARGTNCVTSANDPTAHAEVVAIRSACEQLGDFQLRDCDFYSSCEPCPMCMGALYWARPSRVFFAAGRMDAADAGFDDSFIYEELELPPDKRKVPSTQLLADEGRQPFDSWKEKSDRVEY